MFRRHGPAMVGRHRRVGVVAEASAPDVVTAPATDAAEVPAPGVATPDVITPDVITPAARPQAVDDARARLDPVTRPLPLPVPVTVPGARLRPPERRLIRTG